MDAPFPKVEMWKRNAEEGAEIEHCLFSRFLSSFFAEKTEDGRNLDWTWCRRKRALFSPFSLGWKLTLLCHYSICLWPTLRSREKRERHEKDREDVNTEFFLHSRSDCSQQRDKSPAISHSPSFSRQNSNEREAKHAKKLVTSYFLKILQPCFFPPRWSFAMTWIRERRAGQRRMYVGDEYFPPYSRQFSLSFLGKLQVAKVLSHLPDFRFGVIT